MRRTAKSIVQILLEIDVEKIFNSDIAHDKIADEIDNDVTSPEEKSFCTA